MRKIVVTSLVIANLATISAAPAAASSKFGCEYPRVCFYLTSKDWVARQPTASYREGGQDFQLLGPRSRGSYAVVNTRNDDGAQLEISGHPEVCVRPNRTWFYDEGPNPVEVIGVLISENPSC